MRKFLDFINEHYDSKSKNDSFQAVNALAALLSHLVHLLYGAGLVSPNLDDRMREIKQELLDAHAQACRIRKLDLY